MIIGVITDEKREQKKVVVVRDGELFLILMESMWIVLKNVFLTIRTDYRNS